MERQFVSCWLLVVRKRTQVSNQSGVDLRHMEQMSSSSYFQSSNFGGTY